MTRREIYRPKDNKKNIPAENVVSLILDGKLVLRKDMLIEDDKIVGCIINNTFHYRFDSKQGKNSFIKIYYED